MNTRHPGPANLPQPLLNPPLVKPLRIALLNPNTNTEATRLMLESAQRVLPHWARVEGRTGFVHQAVLDDFADLSGHQVYACGSPIVVELARDTYSALRGLPPEEFYADAFTSEADKHDPA